MHHILQNFLRKSTRQAKNKQKKGVCLKTSYSFIWLIVSTNMEYYHWNYFPSEFEQWCSISHWVSNVPTVKSNANLFLLLFTWYDKSFSSLEAWKFFFGPLIWSFTTMCLCLCLCSTIVEKTQYAFSGTWCSFSSRKFSYHFVDEFFPIFSVLSFGNDYYSNIETPGLVLKFLNIPHFFSIMYPFVQLFQRFPKYQYSNTSESFWNLQSQCLIVLMSKSLL